MKEDNDNDPLTFVHIAALTANVTRYLGLDEKPNEESKGDRNTPETDEQREADKRRYVEQRLRDTLVFEDRARGQKKRGR